MADIITLRKLQTPQQVLDDAQAADLEHVIVLGITKGGENYFQSTGQSTLKHLVWLIFCGNDSVTRMVNSK